jgi:hypothetical protein
MTFLDFGIRTHFFFFFFRPPTIDRAGTQRRARHPQRSFLRRGPLHFCWPNKGQPRDLLDQERCDSAFPKQHVWYGSIFCQGTLLLYVVSQGTTTIIFVTCFNSAIFSYPCSLCSVLCALCSVLCFFQRWARPMCLATTRI